MSARDDSREVFFNAWKSYRAGQPLTGMDRRIVQIVLEHPEYHGLLEDREQHLASDFPPELGVTNPFLHLGMHLAIDEQLAMDQPPGVWARYAGLRGKLGNAHRAQHEIMECLGEVLWHAQRSNETPSEQRYLECLDELVARW